ncbi:MAG: hypothetical protein LBI82_05020 [Dysgonamonadaceae bacterium]|jgi:HEAT repeat protein|nr:hypothetical protein [Dysgonamonadaceae bacterium]
MNDNLKIFRKDFLNANTWAQRKEGVPLDLLDALTKEELKIAENELIDSASLNDTWQIIGLGHIKSTNSLLKLYDLLSSAKSYFKIVIAHSIFQICGDKEMVEITLNEAKKVTDQYQIIDFLYMLPDFNDKRVDNLLREFHEHKTYLVAYNAARVLGLSTDEVVEKFRGKNKL